MRHKSGPRGTTSEKVVKDIRRATRKHYSAEEKIRIVLDGLRGEETIAELCRREGIAQSICFIRQKINLSQVFAGQTVGIKQTEDRIWLVSFMDYDLGYFDDETCRLEPLANPFGPKVLPMSPV